MTAATKSTPPPRRSRSKKAQILNHVSSLLDSGDYLPGQTLPTLRQIADEFHTSITPVIQAMRELEEQGLVEMVQGRGCRVSNVIHQEGKVVARPVIDVIGSAEPQDSRKRRHTVLGLQLGILKTLGATLNVKTTMIAVKEWDHVAINTALLEVVAQKPDGLTIGPVGTLNAGQLSRLRQIRGAGTAVVLFAGGYEAADFDAVESDFRQGQRLLTEYLLQQGHKEILRFSFGNHLYYEQLKQEGFHEALSAAGLPEGTAENSTAVVRDPEPGPDFKNRRLELTTGALAVRLGSRPITAIMAGNDDRVAEVRKALSLLGRDGIEVTGYDGFWDELHDEFAAHYGEEIANSAPPVSVDTNLVECGSQIAEMLVARVQRRLPAANQRLVVPQSLILPGN